MTEAQLLSARGDLDAADRILREWRGASAVPNDIRIRFERARLAERRHDGEEAVRDYRAVVDTWRGRRSSPSADGIRPRTRRSDA